MKYGTLALSGALALTLAACTDMAPTAPTAPSLNTAAPLVSALTVDQAFDAGFVFDLGVNAAGGVSQGFTPTANRLDAVDLFLTGFGTNPAITLTVNIRSASFDGPVVATSTVTVPPGITGSAASPTVVQVAYNDVPLTPGNLYYIQIDPDGGFFGVAASFNNGYPNGQAFQGDFTLPGLDFGFRTYFAVPQGPTSKDQCKDGGWATFTFPHPFKNQGDCIQFVNTGK